MGSARPRRARMADLEPSWYCVPSQATTKAPLSPLPSWMEVSQTTTMAPASLVATAGRIWLPPLVRLHWNSRSLGVPSALNILPKIPSVKVLTWNSEPTTFTDCVVTGAGASKLK